MIKENFLLSGGANTVYIREVTGNNIPILHRIFVRIQGVITKEYWNIPSLSQRRIRAKRQVRWGYYFL
jgi:hypothetical protein